MIFTFSRIQSGHNWGGDFALYINQAKHIVDGFSIDELYELNKTSMQNSDIQIGPYLYPNGFPFLLAPIYYIFGIDLVWFKVLCSLFFILSIPLIYYLFKNDFKMRIYPLILVSIIAFNYKYIDYTDSIISDYPYLFFCILTFYLMKLKNNVGGLYVLCLLH